MRPWALAVLLLRLSALPAFASHPIQPIAPEFPPDNAWINAKPLTLERLKGRRVALLAFLNTDNLNSLRALQTLNRWHDAYAMSGVMIIGVHSPIYDFQKDPSLIRARLKQLGVEFPVVIDSDRRIWSRYKNEGWPSFYLIDRKGKIAYDLAGEQRYTELENEMLQAAGDLGYKRRSDALVAADPPGEDCGDVTAERPVFSGKGVIDLDKPEPISSVLGSGRDGELATLGAWRRDGATLRLTKDNRELSAFLRVIYRGAQAFAVLGPGGRAKTMKFFLRQDGLWLHTGNAGPDVQFDGEGQSFVEVAQPRLYRLTQNPNDELHALALFPAHPGAAVYSFSFSDKCLRYAP